MAQRQQVQKTQRVKRLFVAQVFLNFFFDRFDVRQHIPVGNDHAARLRRRSRSKNDLQRILPRERRPIVGARITLFRKFEQRIQCDHRNRRRDIRDATRTQHQFRRTFPRHPRYKFRRRTVVDRHHHRAAQNAPKENDDPLGRVLRPEQNRIALADSATFQLARHAVRFRRDLRIRPTAHPVSDPMPKRDFFALPRIFAHEFDQRLPSHAESMPRNGFRANGFKSTRGITLDANLRARIRHQRDCFFGARHHAQSTGLAKIRFGGVSGLAAMRAAFQFAQK